MWSQVASPLGQRLTSLTPALIALLAVALSARVGWSVTVQGASVPLEATAPAAPRVEPAATAQAPARAPGLTLKVYRVAEALERLPSLAKDQTPNLNLCVSGVMLPPEASAADLPAPICAELTGWLLLPTSGTWQLRLSSDDGARLWLADKTLIDHDGRHSYSARESAALSLAQGEHALRIEYFDAGGQRQLGLEWRPPGSAEFVQIPAEAFSCELDLARVTSPGVKRLEGSRRPGDGQPLEALHPGWRLEPIRPPGFEPKVSALCFLPDGRLIVGVFDPLQRDDTSLPDIDSKAPDQLWAISNLLPGSSGQCQATPCAAGLFEPLGLCLFDGDLFVAQRLAVTRLRDLDGDGFFEEHSDVASGWEGWNYHQFSFQLVARGQRLYTALSTAMAPPGWEGMGTNAAPNGLLRGAILEIDPQSRSWRAIAGGTRTPNGLGLGPEGILLYSDNQGTWMPTSQMGEVLPGRFFGHFNNTRRVPQLAERFPNGGLPSIYAERPRAPAALYLPHGELSNSPTEPLLISDGPWANQLLIGELTAGGIHRAMLERVDGVLQGAVVRFCNGFEVGINRLCWGPDGALYVGGLGAQGNWNWRGTQFGLQRLVPTGQVVFEIQSVRLSPQGFRVRLSSPCDPQSLALPGVLRAFSWDYLPTAEYGGEKRNYRELELSWGLAEKTGEATGEGQAIDASAPEAIQELWLHLPELQQVPLGSVVHLRLDLTSLTGEPIWSPDAYYTLNARLQQGSVAAAPGEAGFAATVAEWPHPLPNLAQPAPGGLWLIGAGQQANWLQEYGSNAASAPVDQDLLAASSGVRRLESDAAPLVTRAWFSKLQLHLEWRNTDVREGVVPGALRIERNDGLTIHWEAQAPTGTNEDQAFAGLVLPLPLDDAWHRLDLWLGPSPQIWELIPEDFSFFPEEGWLKALIDGKPVGEFKILDVWGLPAGPLTLEGPTRGLGAIELRHTWIAPFWDGLAEFSGAWTELKPSASGGFEPAFEVRGGQAQFQWRQEGDEWLLVGTSVPNSSNTFLTSVAELDEFELEFEVRQDPRLNSGVQIRSQVLGGFGNRTGALSGYQVELDPSPRAFSGGIYEEQGRGWLQPLSDNPAARAAYRPGEWNTVRVLARGESIQTWVNGVPAADLFDARAREGHLAFQVHGVGAETEPLEVAWRRIRWRTQ